MTISLPLQPDEEARLVALARSKGVSTDAIVREAVHRILTETPVEPEGQRSVTGAALVAAMQASPYKEISIEAVGTRLPVRNVEF